MSENVFAGNHFDPATVTEFRLAGSPAVERMAEEECARHGGHCFERTGATLTSKPPQYPEECKHCRKRRVAIPREAWTYRDQ